MRVHNCPGRSRPTKEAKGVYYRRDSLSLGGICSTRRGKERWTKERRKNVREREREGIRALGKRARFDSRAPRVLLIYSGPAIRD